jgi:UPF0716 protein FxsA
MQLFILLFPFFELFTLIELGDRIGSLNTLFYVLGTFVGGLTLLKRQGLNMLKQAQAAHTRQPWISSRLLLDDMAIGFAAILLMIPGLLSDISALVILIAPLRRKLAIMLGQQAPEQTTYYDRHTDKNFTVIEGEYEEKDKK